MSENVVVRSPEAFARRVLPVYTAALARDNFWEADIARKVREVGALWARCGGELDTLLDTVHVMAGELMDTALGDDRDLQKRCAVLRRYGDACGRVAIELLWGFNRFGEQAERPPAGPRDLALAMLAGEADDVRAARGSIAPAYAVVALRATGGPIQAVESAFNRIGGPGVLPLFRGESGYVLLPADREEDAVRTCERVVGTLPHEVWLAVTWVASPMVPEGRETVTDVLALVEALRLAPGAYRRRDVLVEYAAARTPATARIFRRLIEPVMAVDVLRETLEAIIAEDGNRTRAAEKLIIHRSTIDYRLLRIEQLTGHSPSTVQGLRTLTAAYAMRALANQPSTGGRFVPGTLKGA